MAKVSPFKAIRPSADKVHLVASRSYISYSNEALTTKLDDNPFTFLHVLNPEYKSKDATKAKPDFLKVKEKFLDFFEEEIFLQDEQESYYVYRQVKDGNTYTGIIGCASVEDYLSGVIKKHEATIAHREEMFKNYLGAVELNAEPVCFTYPNHKTIDKVTNNVIEDAPVYDFTTTNRVRHTLWLIKNIAEVEKITSAFSEVEAIYIADGHHRSASSALLGKEANDLNSKRNKFMGIFIPEKEMKIYEFNRLVTSLGKVSTQELIDGIGKEFDIIKESSIDYSPKKNNEIGMYIEGSWFSLLPKPNLLNNKLVDALDVSLLTNYILEPLLGISDLRTDKRIYFKGGIEGSLALKKEVDSGKAAVAFAHYPVSMTALKEIADADQIMPPKSTWIEPKLRSGLTIYSLMNQH